MISLQRIYGIYGQMIVQNAAREVLNQYSVDEVHENYNRLSSELAQAIKPRLKNVPLEMSDVTIQNIDYPDVAVAAINNAEERRLDIEREKAQNEIDLLRKKNERALAEAEYQTRMVKARTIRDENRTIAEGISPELLEYYRIENQEIFANNSGEGTTYIPIEGMSSVGAQVRMFSETKTK